MQLRELVHSPAIACSPTASLSEAARLMHRHDTGTVLVVDEAGRLLGIVTDRDLALRGYMRELSPATTVESVMSGTVATVDLDADTSEAMAKMIAHGVRRLAVTDRGEGLAGVISLDDLTMFVEQEADMVRRVLTAQLRPETGGWSHTWDTA